MRIGRVINAIPKTRPEANRHPGPLFEIIQYTVNPSQNMNRVSVKISEVEMIKGGYSAQNNPASFALPSS